MFVGTHHCHIVETGNESYRFRHSSTAAKTKAREHKETAAINANSQEIEEPF